jgi:aspartyl-tRNA(Asn)/glutamyl-tRNA(Gln) amidotransferase subunit C
MAQLQKADVAKLARLARLRLSEEELDKYTKELSSILKYVEMLGSVDTKGLKPTSQVTGLVNVTRADEIADTTTTQAELLKNVPHVQGKLIKVKRMIG